MPASTSANLDLIFSTSSVQPFSSSSSLDFTPFIFARTDSISFTLSFILSKFFCAAWNLSILTKIGSADFGVGTVGTVGFNSGVFCGVSAVEEVFGSSGIPVSVTEGFGGIAGPPCSSVTWRPSGISTCTSSSPGDGMSATADLTIS